MEEATVVHLQTDQATAMVALAQPTAAEAAVAVLVHRGQVVLAVLVVLVS